MSQITITEDVNGKKLPFPLQLHKDTLPALKAIHKYATHEWDGLIIYFGRSGVGKSHTAMLHALYFNAELSAKDIFYTMDEFNEWVKHAKPGSVGIMDEADTVMDAQRRKTVTYVKSRLKHIRDRNLILLFCTPTIRDMSFYFIERARAGVLCKAYTYNDRGHYVIYANNEDDERFVSFYEALKTYNKYVAQAKIKPTLPRLYMRHPMNYVSDWESLFPVDLAEVKRKKHEADKVLGFDAPKDRITGYRRESIVRYYRWFAANRGGQPLRKDVGFIFGISPRTVLDVLRDSKNWVLEGAEDKHSTQSGVEKND